MISETGVATVACEIGKHDLCNGEGVSPRGREIACGCPCHGPRVAPRSGSEARQQGRVEEYAAHIKSRLLLDGWSEAHCEEKRLEIIARFGA